MKRFKPLILMMPVVLISCNGYETKNMMEVSSLKSANSKTTSSWLDTSETDIDNIGFNIEEVAYENLAMHDILIGLTKSEESSYVRQHLTFFIDDSIHNHKLGREYVEVIKRAEWIWENSVNEDVFTIHEEYDESLVKWGKEPLLTSLAYKTFGNFIVNTAKDMIGSDDQSTKFDGISKIYYIRDHTKALWFGYGYSGAAYPAYGLDLRALLKAKLKKSVIEADITINGISIEDNANCNKAQEKFPDFLKNMKVRRLDDKCTIYRFMGVILHEMGHTLMLRHSKYSDSIMNATAGFWNANVMDAYDSGKLHQIDIDAFHNSTSLF